MRITIRQPLKPFSLQPGFRCLIPLTTWEAHIFPTKALLSDLSSNQKEEIPLPFGGKLDGFRVTVDLEKGRIEVVSKRTKPFYLTAESFSEINAMPLSQSKKRLSLGIHKKQDADLILRRGDMAELFPFWLRIADLIPEVSLPAEPVGTMHLLSPKSLPELALAGFEGFFCPRLSDPMHLGLVESEMVPNGASPIGLLHEGARLIESLFFVQNGDSIHILPQLPKEFHAGRFVHLETREGDRFDLEWSKKELKKVVLRPAVERDISLCLQSKLKSFRVRTDLRARGHRVQSKKPFFIKPGQVLYCDRFSHS